MTSDHPDPIDLPALLKICMGQEALAHKLLGQLLLQAPGWLRDLEEAAASRNREQIRFVCHTLCGAAAALKARRLESAAARLGALIRANAEAEIEEAFQETVAAITAAKIFASHQLH